MSEIDPRPAEDERLAVAAELAVRIASGDLDARHQPSDQGDGIDAILNALNMLAEELKAERVSRRRAEDLLHDEIDAYENAPALFCSLDATTLRVEKCNQTLATALGIPKSAILGRSVLDLYTKDYRQAAERTLREQSPRGTIDHGDAELSTADGARVLVSTSARRVAGSDGGERLRIVWRDVTAERKLEAQLVQVQKLDAVGRLSSGVAHDFNNILAIVSGAAALIDHSLKKHGIRDGDIALIEQAVARGSSLTRDLVAFSRQQVIRPRPTDVRSVIVEVDRMVQRLVGEHIVVRTHLPEEGLNVLIDPSQLSQVLINLSINARDALGDSGRLTIEASRVEIDADARDHALDLGAGPYALIAVSDTGSGMTPDVVARAFEPFFTTKPAGEGSGLGLAVCYGIVRQAGGRIRIQTEPGKGTTFRIYLPLTGGMPVPLVDHASPMPRGGSETILVVEDDVDVCAVNERMLSLGGYQVLTAPHGSEALDVVARVGAKLALVMTDVNMPVMGGADLGKELRRRRPDVRIIYVSGLAQNAALTEGDPKSTFLRKPFTSNELLARVRTLLDAE